jgi:uncharacterized protein (TIGR03435 family)
MFTGLREQLGLLPRHDEGTGTKARASCGHILGGRVTTTVSATMLSRQLEHDVTDETGLPGKYDFQLDWTPDAVPAPAQLPTSRPSSPRSNNNSA